MFGDIQQRVAVMSGDPGLRDVFVNCGFQLRSYVVSCCIIHLVAIGLHPFSRHGWLALVQVR